MFEEKDLEEVFALLARIGNAVAATAGPHTEVVVHDLRDPEHTVVAISGNLTRRHIGSPAPDPEFLPGNLNQFKEDLLIYRTANSLGEPLVSSTVWVRDNHDNIVGALCINVDFNGLRQARELLERMLIPELSLNGDVPLQTFASSPEDFVSVALRQALLDVGKEKYQLDKHDKLLVIDRLRDAGVFELRRASELVAEELGVSRASVYAYLKRVRESKSETVESTGS
jgi:predicted transcriptional regulator YheO